MSDNEQENENRETVADIVAQIRAAAYIQNVDTPESVFRLANRIEAAWKRQEQCYLDQIRDAVNMIGHERFVKEHPPSGNAGAMREALENSNGLLEELAVIGEWGESAREQIAENNAALSAPLRNCDINLSAESLWDKFEDYMHDCGLPFYSEPSGEDAFGWLLAPAEERKGE